jgi:hypothetical protein
VACRQCGLVGRDAEVVERLDPVGRIKVDAEDYAGHIIGVFVENVCNVVEKLMGTSAYVEADELVSRLQRVPGVTHLTQ